MNYDSAATNAGPDGKVPEENVLTRWLRRFLEPETGAGTAGLIGASMAPGVGEAIDLADLSLAVKDRDPLRGLLAAAGLAIPFATGSMLKKGVSSGIASLRRPRMKLWHGSPGELAHNRMSLDYIGEGEGAQAYGHGLYGAEARRTAETYTSPGGKIGQLKYVSDTRYEPGMNLFDLERYDTPMGARRRNPLIQSPDHRPTWDPELRALREIDAYLPRLHRFEPEDIEDAALSASEMLKRDIWESHTAEGGVRRGAVDILDDWGYNREVEMAERLSRGNVYELEVDALPSDFLDLNSEATLGDPRIRRLFELAVEGDISAINRVAENGEEVLARVDKAIELAETDIAHTVQEMGHPQVASRTGGMGFEYYDHLQKNIGLLRRRRDDLAVALEEAKNATDFGKRHLALKNASSLLSDMSDQMYPLKDFILPADRLQTSWTQGSFGRGTKTSPVGLIEGAYDMVPNPSWFVDDWSKASPTGITGSNLTNRLSVDWSRQRPIRDGITTIGSRSPSEIADLIRGEGLAGVRFHDGFTRHRGDVPKAYNYVFMDESPIKVVGRYAEGGLVGSRVDQIMNQIAAQ